MSEEILSELDRAEEITPERILSQLLNKKKTPFHTELHNPLTITGLEVVSNYLKDFPLAKTILKRWVSTFKVNMVAYQRKRASEIVEAYKKAEAERTVKTLREILLGAGP